MNELVLNRIIDNDLLVDELSLPSSWRGAKVELRIISTSNHKSSLRTVKSSYGVLKTGKKGIHNNYTDEQLLAIIQDARISHRERIQ